MDLRRAFQQGTDSEEVAAWVRDRVADASPEALEHLLHDLTKPWHLGKHLTHRESQVLALLAGGCRTPEIAKRLGIGLQTVRTYRMRAMSKLGARTTTHAVVLWLTGGDDANARDLPGQDAVRS